MSHDTQHDKQDDGMPREKRKKTFDDLSPVQLTDEERAAVGVSIQTLPLEYRTVEMSRLLGTALRDPDFVPRLRANPRKYFDMYCGIRLPPHVSVVVHPYDENTLHLVLPDPDPRPRRRDHVEGGQKVLVTDADLVSEFAYAKGSDVSKGRDLIADDNDDKRDSVDDPGGWTDAGTDDGKDVKDADADKFPAD